MQSILEKFVRQIDNFSIRKKMIFIYIFCMLLPITLTDGVIIYTVLHTEAQLRRSEMEDIADAVNYQIFYDVDTVSKVAKSIYANKYINDFLEVKLICVGSHVNTGIIWLKCVRIPHEVYWGT